MANMIDRIAVIIDVASSGATQELEKLQGEAKKTGDTFDGLGKKMGLAGSTIKAGLAAGAAAVVGGGLIKLLNDSVDAFQESQMAAQQWASLTNSSIQQAGKFTTVLRQYGIELNDLVEINAEFAAKIKQQPQLLEQYGIAIDKNRDGTINMTNTLSNAISTVSKMKDGVEKTKAALALFGEEGGKQLIPIINAGRDIKDAMDKINFIDNSEDAKEFAANTQDLALSFEMAQIQLGNFLVPYLNDLMGIASGVIEFFSTLPGPVVDLGQALGIAAGGMLIFSKSMDFFKSSTFGTFIVGLLDGIGKIPDAFFEAEGAIAKTKVAVGGLRVALIELGTSAAPLVLLTLAVDTFMAAIRKQGELDDFAESVEIVGKSLEEAANLNPPDTRNLIQKGLDWVSNLGVDAATKDTVALTQAMMDLTIARQNSAKATLADSSATDIQKQKAQALLDIIGEGDALEKSRRLNTEEGTRAMQEYAEAMGGAAASADVLQQMQMSLDDQISDFVQNGANASSTWEDIAASAQAASAQQLQVEQTTNLAEIAMGQFSTSIQGTIGWLDRLSQATAAPEEGLNTLQEVFKNWKHDDPSTWGDEWVIGFEKSKQTLQTQVELWAAQGLTVEQIKVKITELIPTIEGAPSTVLTEDQKTKLLEYINSSLLPSLDGKGNEIPVPLTPTLVPGTPAAGATVTSDVPAGGVPVPLNVDPDGAGKTAVENLTGTKTGTVTINTVFADGGYEAVKSRLDYINSFDGKSPDINVYTHFHDGSYNDVVARLDHIMSYDQKSPDIDVWVHFHPEYQTTLDRLNNLSRNRTVNIDVNTRGLAAAEASIRSLSTTSTVTQRIVIPKFEMPQPINIVKVNVDGQSLRATIRDELMNVRKSDDLVAAMGVVA